MRDSWDKFRLYFTGSLGVGNKLGRIGLILIRSPEWLDVNGQENQQKRTIGLEKSKRIEQDRSFPAGKLHTIHSSLSPVEEIGIASLLVSYC